MQVSRNTRGRLLLLALAGCLVAAVGPANGHLDSGAALVLRIDGALRAARDAVFGDDVETVDLGDGRSRVPAYWKANFERFAESDRAHAPAPGGIVFVGSSSIDFWTDLADRFPGQDVVRRGLAGATMADCAAHLDRLVLPYRPRTVVVYAGDNDLAAGATPERVVADYAALVRRVHRDLPGTRFVFVSIKPSLARESLMPAMKRTNAMMATFAATDRRLTFVDVFDPMLDRDGHPRRELFGKDGLHMTGAGYALWHDAIAPHLD